MSKNTQTQRTNDVDESETEYWADAYDATTVELEALAEDYEKLREVYDETRHVRYRRQAYALAALGVIGAVAGLYFSGTRTVLWVLAGIGLFSATLTYYLPIGPFVPADTYEYLYDVRNETGREFVESLDLRGPHVYVPSELFMDDRLGNVRLFVPQREDFALPEADALTTPFIVTDNPSHHGLSLRPTGAALFSEFETTMVEAVASTPEPLSHQLTEAIEDGFELVERAQADVQAADGRLVVRISGSVLGSVDRFDHPVRSFFGVGVASGLNRPITVETNAADDEEFDVRIECKWTDDNYPEGDLAQAVASGTTDGS